MLRNFFTRSTINTSSKLSKGLKYLTPISTNTNILYKRLLLAGTSALFIHFIQPTNKLSFYMDETLEKTKEDIENHILVLKKKYGEQVMSFP
jgi:hypothetical protein